MPNFCNIQIGGHLGGDPDFGKTNKGNDYCNFNIAYNHSKEKAIWFQCSCWNRHLIQAAQELKKGDGVVIYGKITNDRWVDENGTDRPKIKIRVVGIEKFVKHEKGQQNSSEAPPHTDEDLPF